MTVPIIATDRQSATPSEGRPRVSVVFTGGTISMTVDPATGLASPSLDGGGILARTPGLDAIADVEAIDWGLVPASHLRFGQILEIARLIRSQLERDNVAGVVVVQGTDVIEETSFAWDLLLDSRKPVVVVGAMRTADHPGYEGPANLRDAIRVAASPGLAGEGVVVVMDGDIWPADDVTKTHTDRYDTFQALNFGPLGRIADGRVVLTSHRTRRRLLPAIPDSADARVELVTAVVAMDGTIVRDLLRVGIGGIVVAATGSGNTHPDLLAAAIEAMAAGIPVVQATRVPSGRVSSTYGFPGGGGNWARAGIIQAGYLGGPKARVALALAIGCGLDRPALRALFEDG
jgi:L-asparaginase